MLTATALFTILVLAWGSRAVSEIVGDAIASLRTLIPVQEPAWLAARHRRRASRSGWTSAH